MPVHRLAEQAAPVPIKNGRRRHERRPQRLESSGIGRLTCSGEAGTWRDFGELRAADRQQAARDPRRQGSATTPRTDAVRSLQSSRTASQRPGRAGRLGPSWRGGQHRTLGCRCAAPGSGSRPKIVTWYFCGRLWEFASSVKERNCLSRAQVRDRRLRGYPDAPIGP